MKFADSKDIKRAQDLGKHSGAVNSSPAEIARGKASAMAQAITDKRKILGRLEAIADQWKDYEVVRPFIERCTLLWPNSQYDMAYQEGHAIGIYLKTQIRSLGIGKDLLLNKYLISNESGTLISGRPYEFDEVARLIYNIMLERRIKW
jgi:hypothetical protein